MGTPVPDNATVCGLLPAASENVSVAVSAPVVVGLNRTLTVQLAEAARLSPQELSVIKKSAASSPDNATLSTAIGTAPPLVNVIDCDALEDPTAVVAKVTLAGAMLALGINPVPDNVTV